MKLTASSIEPLEARIAPAMASLQILGPHKATYTDVDGDLVTVVVSSGTLTAGLFNGVASGIGDQLSQLDLSGIGNTHPSISIVAKPQFIAGKLRGDGLVNVGRIGAPGVNLGAVFVGGDLGEIDAGDNTGLAVAMLNVHSIGERGLDTGAFDIESTLAGKLGALVVKGNVRGAYIHVTGPHGAIGGVFIGGSLIGNAVDSSGRILSDSTLGPVKVVGDVLGGAGTGSGGIDSNGAMVGVSIGGSVIGGSGMFYSGYVSATGNIGAVKIGGDIVGGSGLFSGLILGRMKVGSVFVGGSVIGGSGSGAGEIVSEGTTGIGSVFIGHNLIGGTGDSTGSVDSSGPIGSIIIGGSIIGAPATAAAGTLSGDIRANVLGAIKVGGSLIGTAAHPVVISAEGFPGTGPNDHVLGGLFVGGRVEWSNVLLGYGGTTPVNADAQAGSIVVAGDWIASNLIAGVRSVDAFFGDPNDAVPVAGVDYGNGPAKNDSAVLSKIASITIGGGIYGAAGAPGPAHFAFEAEQIGAFKVGGVSLALKPGAKNDSFASSFVHPVGASLSTGLADGFAVHVLEV